MRKRMVDLFGDQGNEILDMMIGAGLSVIEECSLCGGHEIDDYGCFDCFVIAAVSHSVEAAPDDEQARQRYYEEEAFNFLEGFLRDKGRKDG